MECYSDQDFFFCFTNFRVLLLLLIFLLTQSNKVYKLITFCYG